MEVSNNDINFVFTSEKDKIYINCDEEQINRVLVNLIKNSIESIIEKCKINADFTKKISIDINEKDNYIYIIIFDNGAGFLEKNLKNIVKPYFTTKTKGTGLGLAIVNKIINDHDGKILFIPQKDGAKIEINLPKNVS